MDAALVRLGPPERVAAEARADLPPPTATAPVDRHPRRARVAALTSLGLLILPAATTLVARALGDSGDDTGMFLGPHPGEALMLLPLTFPVWLVAVAVALVGRDIGGPTKARLVVLGPVTAALVITGALLRDSMAVSLPLTFVGLPALLVGLVLTGRRAWRETSAPTSGAQVVAGAAT